PFATADHQARNAESFGAVGAAILLRDDACTAERLEKEIRTLLDDPIQLKSMGDKALTQVPSSAVETIVEEIFSIVFEPPN
ncbi:MAG: UDP-N-acetylglucosamine--N-acetylmuramyl-(pentapeptide) pyrophosphoryl-undecaprenol N-acetylglucosamine transferase, partial [Candidatus Hydrogenedentes bacterium]|nr:UDP-N-acetylglucosamine--N-acetylmuramyl-(pentapeptide) pyrophosphoryl-undecaprenol N-acetylglucosamine transferase [Candidatus Hydrogenedentota bacterium]